jgi:aminocarboxymuconate-semialdehyde decarboxylase
MARGVQAFTNIAGHPLDEPRFRPFFAAMAARPASGCIRRARRCRIMRAWLQFEMWWCFGWPYETTIAMCRLVVDGIYDRHRI